MSDVKTPTGWQEKGPWLRFRPEAGMVGTLWEHESGAQVVTTRGPCMACEDRRDATDVLAVDGDQILLPPLVGDHEQEAGSLLETLDNLETAELFEWAEYNSDYDDTPDSAKVRQDWVSRFLTDS